MSALQIVELKSENVLILSIEEFAKIIAKDDLGDRSLVIISIAGAMRRGKSFLLNFFLSYAYNKYPTKKTIETRKKLENGPMVDGFSHSGGSERHTTGIQVWPDIFLHEDQNGKKIAIILMDTQGSFDYETKFNDCVTIFALSTILASVQIYNINHNVQNDHLQYLALFIEYAKLALDKISPIADIPFDTLQILVRDWQYPYEAKYGFEGGATIIDKAFSTSNHEIKKTVTAIKETFNTIEGFLMPYPGDGIATARKFNGNIEKVDEKFLKNVDLLTEHLLSPERLKIKKINGIELKGSNFKNLVRESFEILNKCENLPKPKPIVAANADSHNFKLIASAVDFYKKSISAQLCEKPYMENEDFMKLHQICFADTMHLYKNAKKFELLDEESNAKWMGHLEGELLREYNYYLICNEKNQPDNSTELQQLINVVTEQKDLAKELNERHAQNMLNLINTFRQREEEHREHVVALTTSFRESPQQGFDLMAIVVKLVDIIPTAILVLGLANTTQGKAALAVCKITSGFLKMANSSIEQP